MARSIRSRIYILYESRIYILYSEETHLSTCYILFMKLVYFFTLRVTGIINLTRKNAIATIRFTRYSAK